MSTRGHGGGSRLPASLSIARSRGSSVHSKGNKGSRLSRFFGRSKSESADTRTETNATSVYSSSIQPRKPETTLANAPTAKSAKPANINVPVGEPQKGSKAELSTTDGVLQRLGVVIDEMFKFLLRTISDDLLPDQHKAGFQNTFKIYRLWETAFDIRSGGLDGLARYNKHLLDLTLRHLQTILRTLSEGLLPALGQDLKLPDDLAQDIKDVLPPAEDYDDESLLPSSNSSSCRTEEDILNVNLTDLRSYVECLGDLSSSIAEALETGLYVQLDEDDVSHEEPAIRPEDVDRSGSKLPSGKWLDDLPEGRQQREREERTWQSQHTSPAAIRRLRELMQIKHTYDMEIWDLQESRELNRPVVLEIIEKADEVSDEIYEIVESWEGTEKLWDSKEWERALDIKQRLKANNNRRWRDNPP